MLCSQQNKNLAGENPALSLTLLTHDKKNRTSWLAKWTIVVSETNQIKKKILRPGNKRNISAKSESDCIPRVSFLPHSSKIFEIQISK